MQSAAMETLNNMVIKIEKKLAELGISGHVQEVCVGPHLYTLEYQAKGQKVKQVASLEEDLSALLKQDVRVVLDKGIKIEVPKIPPEDVPARYILPDAFAIDALGRPVSWDWEKCPHLLIAGATGAGKSHLIHVLVATLTGRAQLYGIDLKRVELGMYRDREMFAAVATDKEEVQEVLESLLREMEDRYLLMEERKVNHIDQIEKTHIVCIIDEYAELKMAFGKKEFQPETAVIRLAQLGRAAGIHLIVATQRPDSKIISPVVKANFPFRICLRVAGKGDERVMDCPGATRLTPPGDALANLRLRGKWERIHTPRYDRP